MRVTCPLSKAFAEDHRHMTRGFYKLRKALESGDLKTAVETSRIIDVRVGPHIQFEEDVFYPELRKTFGDEYVERLYHEHAIGRSVITELMGLEPGQELAAGQLQDLAKRARRTLDHAVSCGTLLSHLDALSLRRRNELMAEFETIRDRGIPWSRQTPRGLAKQGT